MTYKPKFLTPAEAGLGAATTATSNTILKGNGTNWVASTETYAAPSTSGNVMTSDGTNWTSAAPAAGTWGGYTVTTVSSSLTSAQIKALHGTPIQVAAAPGSGKVIVPIQAMGKFIYGGTNVFVAGAAQTIALSWGTVAVTSSLASNAIIVGTTTQLTILNGPGVSAQLYSRFDNTALNLYNSVVTEISGNAANDNTLSYTVTYITITI